MTTATRIVERRIVRRFVRDALAAGYRLAVSLERGYDVDEGMLNGSRSLRAVLDEAFAGDDCHVFVQPADGPLVETSEPTVREQFCGLREPVRRVVSVGWVALVLGNGCDVISDYSTNLEVLLAPALAVAEKCSWFHIPFEVSNETCSQETRSQENRAAGSAGLETWPAGPAGNVRPDDLGLSLRAVQGRAAGFSLRAAAGLDRGGGASLGRRVCAVPGPEPAAGGDRVPGGSIVARKNLVENGPNGR